MASEFHKFNLLGGVHTYQGGTLPTELRQHKALQVFASIKLLFILTLLS